MKFNEQHIDVYQEGICRFAGNSNTVFDIKGIHKRRLQITVETNEPADKTDIELIGKDASIAGDYRKTTQPIQLPMDFPRSIDIVPLYQRVYLNAKNDYETGKDSHSPVNISELYANGSI